MKPDASIPQLFMERLMVGESVEDIGSKSLSQLSPEQRDARMDTLRVSNADILEMYPPVQMRVAITERQQLRRAQRQRTLWIPASGVAVATALLALMIYWNAAMELDPREMREDEYIGLKSGDPVLRVYRRLPDGQEALGDGAVVRKGETLQLLFLTGDATSLAILSLDGADAVTLHYPPDEGDSTQVTSGERVVVPYAYVLDDAPAFERFFLFFRTDGEWVDVSTVRRILEQMTFSKQRVLQVPSGLRYQELWLRKAPDITTESNAP